MFKKLLSLSLALVMTLSMGTSAFAAESSTVAPQNLSTGTIISHAELPEEYQQFIDPQAVIYQQEDGSYDVFQNKPIVEPKRASSDLRYAPNGGSYSDLENSSISLLTYVVYQTYLPRDEVTEWIADNVTGMEDYVLGLIATLSLNQADKILAKVLTKYGISLSLSTIYAIAQGTLFTLDWLNYEQVEDASNKGKNGILIEYLTSIGAGNVRSYSPWTSSYVPRYPRGGDATWHPGDYYVMP